MRVSDGMEPSPSSHGEGDGRSADAELLEALVREHRDAAVAYATRILGDASLAEDAVQRALLQILLRIRAGDDQLLAVNPRAVVLRGTRWAALKLADRHSSRDEAQRRAAVELLGGDDHDWDRLEARMLVEDILPSLPEHYRDVLRLRYLEGQPDATAARNLSVTLKAYRRRLDRALVVARVAAVRIGVTSLGAAGLAALRRLRLGRQRLALAGRRGSAPWWPFGSETATARTSVGHVVLAAAMLGMVVGAPALRSGDRPAQPRTGVLAPPGAAAAPHLALVGSTAGNHLDGVTSRHVRRAARGAVVARRAAAPGGVETVVIDDVVGSVHASQNHTAVAEGQGVACACHLLLQTTDGGASWSAYPAPGTGVMLPPDYPRDPRVLLQAALPASFGLCVEARIADGTCALQPAVPAGTMVLDPDFDAGYPVVYDSNTGGVMSYNLATGEVHALELAGNSSIDGIPLAPAGGSGPYSVYLLVNGAPTSETAAGRAHPLDAPFMGHVHVVGCRHDGSCTDLASQTPNTYQIFGDRDPSAGGVVVTSDGLSLRVSTDSGAHFQTVAEPRGLVLTDFEIRGIGRDLRISALLGSGAWTHTLFGVWQASSGWTLHSLDAIAPPLSTFHLADLGGGRTLVGGSGAASGLFCTTDGGVHWLQSCAPA